MVMRGTWTLLMVAVVAFAGMAGAQGFTAQGTPTVKFTGKGPMGFTLVGTTQKLALEDDGKALTFKVPLDTLDTGIALRDRHMKEKYLDTAKFPNVVLVVPRGTLKLPQAGQASEGQANGKLTLHGVTKEVPFTYKVQRTGDAHAVTGVLKFNFRDFGVEVPSYAGITVKPDIVVDVAFEAKGS